MKQEHLNIGLKCHSRKAGKEGKNGQITNLRSPTRAVNNYGNNRRKCGLLGWMLVAVAAAMVIDFLAGMAASAKEAVEHPDDDKYGWSSRKGMIGIFKKFGYILVIVASMILDFLIYKLSGVLSVTLPMTMFFSTLVTAWFILNECLSITENAGRMGVKYLHF